MDLRLGTPIVLAFGPFVNPADGTVVTGLASALDDPSTGIKLAKNGAAGAVRHTAVPSVYDNEGDYLVALDATDTGTAGTILLSYNDPATTQDVELQASVLSAAAWDALYSVGTVTVTPNVGALSVSGIPGNIRQNNIENPLVGAVALTGNAPILLTNVKRNTLTGTIAFTGAAPLLQVFGVITTQAGLVFLNGAAPVLSFARVIAPNSGSITLVGANASLLQNINIRPLVTTITVTGNAGSTLNAKTITPQTGTLTLLGVAPTISTIGSVSTGTGLLQFLSAPPVLTIQVARTPQTGSLTLNGLPATVIGQPSTTIQPKTGSISIVGRASGNFFPRATALVLTGNAPIVKTTVNRISQSTTNAIKLTGYKPIVTHTVTTHHPNIPRVILRILAPIFRRWF